MKSEELSENVLAGLKKLYAGKTIEIEVNSVDFTDDTEYLLSSENNRLHLEDALREAGGQTFSVEEFSKFVAERA